MMILDFLVHLYFELPFLSVFSLRSRRLEVVGERENRCARGRHARVSPLACLLLARQFFSCAHYFQAPATQARACL